MKRWGGIPRIGLGSQQTTPAKQKTTPEGADMELMSAIIEPNNMHLAYRRVTRNKGSAGVDGMRVEQLKAYL